MPNCVKVTNDQPRREGGAAAAASTRPIMQADGEVARIRECLEGRQPRLLEDPTKMRAAVAAVFLPSSAGLELLFIERAEVEGDPWSGHIGFPGGKLEAGDLDLQTAAERETEEELGLALAAADCLGRLDDLSGSTLPVLVSGFCYVLQTAGKFLLSEEVRDAFWVATQTLADPRRRTEHLFNYGGVDHAYPAIDLGGGRPPLWGLTYRFVVQLLNPWLADYSGLRSV